MLWDRVEEGGAEAWGAGRHLRELEGISGNGTGVGQSLKAGASWNADGPDWALQEFREALGTGGRKASEVTVKTGFASGSHGELSEDFRGEGNTL